MAVEKAKEFLEFLVQNPAVAEKMKGFNFNELKQAAFQLKEEGKLNDSSIGVNVLVNGFVHDIYD